MTEPARPPIQGDGGIETSHINFSPAARVTVPDVTDWHVVSDDELQRLSKPEGGILGNIGFGALGGALGALPSGCTAVDKISSGQSATSESFRSLLIMLPCIAVMIVCLALFAIDKYRAKGLVAQIKARPTKSGSGVSN
ncbi:MAG: hypothetical protein ACK4TC_05570 [Sphingomonas pseudosanguinis]|uniref:hypothetical protein n=1 Tax=Sphingomonas pseudosanguinis TaxID=413712 RepID=UPI00391DB680